MLFRSELKKLLLIQKGLLLLVVCLVLKFLCLALVPEMKDPRIQLSHKQYDNYLEQLHGENTPEKSDWILAEYQTCKATINDLEFMQTQYTSGAISQEEWESYSEALNEAYLHKNAAKIFSEKAEQFLFQSPELPPAHYIYEYGWQTVFTLQKLPDIFLIFGLLLLSAQCFSTEAVTGMLPVLLSARNGRRKLFSAKLLALLTVSICATAVSAGMEAAVFFFRGWCNDPDVPLYSVKALTECTLSHTLLQGYLLSLLLRSVSAVLFAAMIYGLSVWLKNTTNLIFLGLCLLALPVIWGGTVSLFTHGGLLCGTKTLLLLGNAQLSPWIPTAVVTAATVLLLLFAQHRHQKGL